MSICFAQRKREEEWELSVEVVCAWTCERRRRRMGVRRRRKRRRRRSRRKGSIRASLEVVALLFKKPPTHNLIRNAVSHTSPRSFEVREEERMITLPVSKQPGRVREPQLDCL